MPDRNKNILLGIFVLTACAAVMWILFTLQPRVGDGKQTLNALFSNINNISPGTQVTYAGRPVGEVFAIDPVSDPMNTPVDSSGRRYVYLVRMRIDSHVHLYDTDEVTVATSGLMGDKSVAIIPRKPPDGQVPRSVDGQTLLAESSDAIDTAVQKVGELSASIGTAMKQVGQLIEDNRAELKRAVHEFANTMQRVQEAVQQLDEQGLFQTLPKAVKHLHSIVRALDQPEALRQSVENIEAITTSVARISQQVESGSGTLGALVMRQELYDQVHSLLESGEDVLESIRKYGLLFHNDRRWQRQQKAEQKAPCISAGDKG